MSSVPYERGDLVYLRQGCLLFDWVDFRAAHRCSPDDYGMAMATLGYARVSKPSVGMILQRSDHMEDKYVVFWKGKLHIVHARECRGLNNKKRKGKKCL